MSPTEITIEWTDNCTLNNSQKKKTAPHLTFNIVPLATQKKPECQVANPIDHEQRQLKTKKKI